MSWITESVKRGSDLRKHFKMHDIEIFIKDALPSGIDIDFVFKYVASVLPSYLMTEVDIVYIGEFEELKKRSANALFQDGAIYVTNEQNSEMDIIDDLIHEVAHSIEKKYIDRIYGDGAIEREFKKKRKELYDILMKKGKNPPPELVTNMNYSLPIDDYFFHTIGYPVLGQICAFGKLFTGPYSATSIREYFATGFDQYFLGDEMLVRNFSPSLYRKIQQLTDLGEE